MTYISNAKVIYMAFNVTDLRGIETRGQWSPWATVVGITEDPH